MTADRRTVFVVFRVLLGSYLSLYFARLVPYGKELFSSDGVLPTASANPTHPYFPGFLSVWDSPEVVTTALLLLTVLALAFSVGLARQPIALLLWYGWVSLCHRSNLVHNPSLPYVSWLLLASAAIPSGEGLLLPGTRLHASTARPGWRLPPTIAFGGWLTLGVGYFASGADKLLNSRSWRNGDALSFILEGPLVRDGWLGPPLAGLPEPVFAALGWLVLAAELGFGPLSVWSATRRWVWISMTLVHLGILLTLDFTELTVGMLIAHAFVFDPEWLSGVGPSRTT